MNSKSVINVPIMGIGRPSAMRMDWPVRAQGIEGACIQCGVLPTAKLQK
jgi:hypothetical protein